MDLILLVNTIIFALVNDWHYEDRKRNRVDGWAFSTSIWNDSRLMVFFWKIRTRFQIAGSCITADQLYFYFSICMIQTWEVFIHSRVEVLFLLGTDRVPHRSSVRVASAFSAERWSLRPRWKSIATKKRSTWQNSARWGLDMVPWRHWLSAV